MKMKTNLLFLFLFCIASATCVSAQEMREWSDSTGKFKIQAKFIEVKDGIAWLENEAGKTIKIPVDRLSSADLEYVGSNENPFKMAEEESSSSSGSSSSSSSGSRPWSTPKKIDFDQVERLHTISAQEFQDCVPEHPELGFEPKQVPLSKKSDFHEHMHPLILNTKLKRGVAGFTVSFAVPVPATRLSLLDLSTGRSVHTDPVEATMRPLALLDSGAAFLMVGTGDDRSKHEKNTELQVWTLKGKSIVRTESWIPLPDLDNRYGRNGDAPMLDAFVVDKDKVLTLSGNGYLVLWDIIQREAIWHARLNPRNFGVDLSPDRSRLAIFDDKAVLVVEPKTAQVLGATSIPGNTNVGWNRVRWSPDGKKLLCTSVNTIRVLNVENGEWETDFHLDGGPVAANALSFPTEEFALLNDNLLLHLESKIKVCQYSGATHISTIAGESFIAMHTDAGGFVVPAKFPHPTATEILQTAMDDPSTFLIHPGVGVAIDTGRAGVHQGKVKQGLEQSVANSGYEIDPSSPIRIIAEISGPKQRAVSYIASGSYIANEYSSVVKLVWNGKELWSRSGSNVPGFIQTRGDETIQDVLDRAGTKPNLDFFGRITFPEFMQRPSKEGGAVAAALMSSRFTPQGLIDTK